MSRYEFSVPGLPDHVGEARALLASFLAGVGVPVEAVDNAVVAVSELVTNAVLYSASGLEGGKVTLRAEVAPQFAQVDVVDAGPLAAGQVSPHPMARRAGEGGMGLFMVAGLSQQIGDYDTPDGQHAVWFRITWPPQGVRHG